jgi:amicyanin
LIVRQSLMHRTIAALLLVMVLIPTVLAGEADKPAAQSSTVRIGNFTFDPPEITVAAGTTVIWINEDDIPHTVASTAKVFKSKALDTDQQFSFTFGTPGTYDYFCSLHPHMQGKVVVK